MYGLGTQDNLTLAKDFVAKTGVTVPMYWDKSSESWQHFGIRSQPAAVLLDRTGHIIKAWKSGVDLDAIKKALPA